MSEEPVLLALMTKGGKLIAEMEHSSEDGSRLFGAVTPGIDANYYKEILIGGYISNADYDGFNSLGYSLDRFWNEYLIPLIKSGECGIDNQDEFNFSIEEVKCVELASMGTYR